jgi:hypothetical protein
VRFGSASHVTDPDPLTLMNLYSMIVPGASRTLPVQSGLFCVYSDASRLTAFLGFQFPSAGTLPVLPGTPPSVCIQEQQGDTSTVFPLLTPLQCLPKR